MCEKNFKEINITRKEWVGGDTGSRVIGSEAEKLSGTDHTTFSLTFYSKWHSKPFENCVKRGDRIYSRTNKITLAVVEELMVEKQANKQKTS